MKAVLCSAFGGPDALKIADLPAPRPQKGEVVVKVGAAALNFFDTLIIAGKYRPGRPCPFRPAASSPAPWSRPVKGSPISSPATG